LQRDRKQRKQYSDDWAFGDEEIEGQHAFDLEEKLTSQRFEQGFVKEMLGHGNLACQFLASLMKYILGFFLCPQR
jgi:hypothetical protein